MRLRPPWDWEAPCLRRRFGYPGQIDAGERVWVTIAPGPLGGAVTVNGRGLGRLCPGSPFAADITALLLARNVLTIDVADGTTDPRPALGEVALEVRRTAYLAGPSMRLTAGNPVRLSGSCAVEGTADGLLDFYALCEGRTVYQAAVTAPQAVRFDAAVPGPDPGSLAALVRLDLVQGAVVWYTIEERLPVEHPAAPNP